MGFYPTRKRKCQKNSKTIQKIRKHHHSYFQAKIGWERPRKRENKNNRSDEFSSHDLPLLMSDMGIPVS